VTSVEVDVGADEGSVLDVVNKEERENMDMDILLLLTVELERNQVYSH